ncbi:MAG: VOC family protein [Planctomycetia bacterium]|nr:VOC family protein [Planctomycetia bacterium]
MRVELDHFFIRTSVGAPEADRLVEFGLSEGAPNRHPGQGTANRRFFFSNAFLELLWVEDPAEAQSSLIRRARLWKRWSRRSRGSSPFGICLRPVGQQAGEIPFPAWEYRPPYLPDPLVIQMGANSEVPTEPLLFYIKFGRRADSAEESRRQPLEHVAGLKAVARLRVSSPHADAASAVRRAVKRQCPCLSFVAGSKDCVEIGFDGETAGKSMDFRPTLPLIFRW